MVAETGAREAIVVRVVVAEIASPAVARLAVEGSAGAVAAVEVHLHRRSKTRPSSQLWEASERRRGEGAVGAGVCSNEKSCVGLWRKCFVGVTKCSVAESRKLLVEDT